LIEKTPTQRGAKGCISFSASNGAGSACRQGSNAVNQSQSPAIPQITIAKITANLGRDSQYKDLSRHNSYY